MRRITRRITTSISLLLLVLAGGPLSSADGKVVDGFAAALADASAASRPLAVLVHGATWQGASRRLVEEVWRTEVFREGLEEAFTLTEISVVQNADDATKKIFSEETKGWDAGTVRTFPAVQVFGPDGHLLKTLSGSDLRDVAASADRLAAAITHLGQASGERDRLRKAIAASASRGADVSSLIDSLNQLGLMPEKDAVKIFRQVDPEDRSGWAARLSFQGWEFIRGITGRIQKGEANAALAEIEALLANEHYEPSQRCLLLAAKGMALTALDRTEEAWQAYRLGYAWDRDGVNGKAVIRHAFRTVGSSLRVAPSAEALMEGGGSTINLSRARATVMVVPPDPVHDKPADHSSLFSGPLKEFAFHSAESVGPAVMIDLGGAARIGVIRLVNRSSHQDRASGITVWLSDNATDWRQVWQAEDVAADWTIDLRSIEGQETLARYLKVGLPPDRKGILHLRAVDVFGSHPDDAAAPAGSNGLALDTDQLPSNTAINMQFDPSRIDMRAIAAYARGFLESGEQQPHAGRLTDAANGVLKYTKPITWRSETDERVKGTAVIITPATITIEHEGRRTEVDRKRFSTGSKKVLEMIEAKVRDFFEVVENTKVTRPPAIGDPPPKDQAAQ